MYKKIVIQILTLLIFALFFSTSSNAALTSRLGGQAFYDDVLDITWLADANYAYTSGYDSDGQMTWATASTWAAGLTIDGVGGWRLPTMIDTNAVGCDWTTNGTDCGYNMQTGSADTVVYSEYASLWTDTLGNLAYYDTDGNEKQPGWGLQNTGPFLNIQAGRYFTNVIYEKDTRNAWRFNTENGGQGSARKAQHFYAWAVHSGDVAVVPVPASLWLFGSGLIGLVGIAKRKRVTI